MLKLKRLKYGFTLIEILLVIGVIMTLTIIKTKDINEENENIRAKILAGQIKTVAQASNALLVMKYQEFSALSVPNVSCNSGNQTCDLTLKNLSDYGLLSPNFSNKTVLGDQYYIQLKRTGVAPNYMFSGIVLTKSKISDPVFAGKVSSYLGQDGGVNKKVGEISGVAGGWSADKFKFPVLTDKIGYVGETIGTLSGAYYVYLRRDGTLPMTGDLDLGINNINNVKNITATGNISGAELNASGNINAGGNIVSQNQINAKNSISAGTTISAKGNIYSEKEIIVKNAYGDAIAIGGDQWGNDYEIRLDKAKPLSIFSPNATDYTTVLSIGKGNAEFAQRLGLMGVNPNMIPSGWSGGLSTIDVYATGTVGVGAGGGLSAYLTSSGHMYAAGNMDANYLHSRGGIYAAGNADVGYLRSRGNIDANASIYAQYIKSHGNLDASGRINTNEFVYIGGVANEGWGCAPNGLLGRNSAGAVLSCTNGVWQKSSGANVSIVRASGYAWRWPSATAFCPAGKKVVGGGASCSTSAAAGFMFVVRSIPIGDNQWHGACDTPEHQNASIEVYALCI